MGQVRCTPCAQSDDGVPQHSRRVPTLPQEDPALPPVLQDEASAPEQVTIAFDRSAIHATWSGMRTHELLRLNEPKLGWVYKFSKRDFCDGTFDRTAIYPDCGGVGRNRTDRPFWLESPIVRLKGEGTPSQDLAVSMPTSYGQASDVQVFQAVC